MSTKTQSLKTSTKWGYIFALWTAVLWGAWYVPGTAIWYEEPFVSMAVDKTNQFLIAAAIITALSAYAVLFFLLIWNLVLGKFNDIGRTFVQFRKISKWYFLAAIFGGPCAIFGSYLAMGYVGPVFAAISALLYPVVGATLARLWYKETISARAAFGIFLIIVGGVATYVPGILGELSAGNEGAWLGYLGGLMAALGWGIEGAIAGRALDVSEADSGIAVRMLAEVGYWSLLILPAIALFTDFPIWSLILQTVTNAQAMIWVLLCGSTFGFCYVAWYKSFPLIGVGRGQAIADIYGVFAVIFLAIFTLTIPEWNFFIGLLLAVTGGFVMISEGGAGNDVVRNFDQTNSNSDLSEVLSVENART